MNDLNRRIQEALRGTDAGDALAGEPNLAGEAIAAFRGRNRWTTLLVVFLSLVGMVLAVWGGLRFYGAEAVQEQLHWGGLSLLGLLFICLMKVWFWMEMHSNRILRELERVELLLLQSRG